MNSLFLSMLPIYLLGNLHCIGMCGPLVLMIGSNRHKYWYFFGRTSSFTLAGLLAGELGAVLNITFSYYYFSSLASLLFGIILCFFGILSFFKKSFPKFSFLSKQNQYWSKRLTLLLLKDEPLSTFLFGFFTVMLPCGQTLIVFSACALSGSAFTGIINGFAFALLTSPSLFLAMHAHKAFQYLKHYYNSFLSLLAIVVGLLSICRGLADADLIPHLVLNSNYHIVLF